MEFICPVCGHMVDSPQHELGCKESDIMDRNYKSSNPGVPITVNVDEWMKQAHGPRATPKPAEQEHLQARSKRQEEIERAKIELRDYKENYLARNERAARQAKLSIEKSECTECGRTEFFYKDDYMCYQCREKLDA